MSVEDPEFIDTRYEESDLKNTKEFELIQESKEYALYRPHDESEENTEGEFFIVDKWRKGVIEVRNYDIVGFLRIVERISDVFEFEDKTFDQSEQGKAFLEKLRRQNQKGTKEHEEFMKFVKDEKTKDGGCNTK